MATLDDLVNVQISLNTASVQRAEFGVQLIAAPHASFAELTRTYTAYDGTNADNLPASVQTALAAAFSQVPHPNKVKVGRLSVDKVTIAPADAVASAVYSLKIDGTLVSVTASGSPTTSTIATQLATAINTAALGVTATAVTGTVELVFTGAVKAVTNFVKIVWVSQTPSSTVTMATDLGSIQASDNAWYVLHLTERTKQRQLDAAAYIETQEKLFITSTDDPNALLAGNATDLLSMLKAANYLRSAGAYDANASTEYMDVAWAARVLPIQPGAETWALKRLNGATSDSISKTQQTAVFGKNGNTFERYSENISVTNPGKVAFGEFLDTVRFRDWLKDTIQGNMVQMLVNRNKLPYTDQGIQTAASNLRASLREGQRVGGIAPDEVDANNNPVPGFNMTVPLAADIPVNIKATRVLTLGFNARLAGAIHMINITGALAYEL